MTDHVELTVDGSQVSVPSDITLLDALRDHVGVRSPKDGCSPQGQCGCCTVLVDGAPRVACVTPVRRVRGREIVTAEMLPDASVWADAFCQTGASQCGFCTPGIIVRLAGLRTRSPDAGHEQVEQALLAHLCRCTGWRTILDAWDAYGAPVDPGRDLEAASQRARIESGGEQVVSPGIALGRAPFADDTAPRDALVAVLGTEGPDSDARWTLADSVATARSAAGKVQGRRTTAETEPPLALPEGAWDLTLRTSWVEPGYLETDASWAGPRTEPADPLANSGAFGGKERSPVVDAARRLAAEHDRPVRVLLSREDTVRLGPKRPPIAAGLRRDGSGVIRVARTDGIADAIRSVLPDATVEEVDVDGPPTSTAIRGAGWVEASVLAAALAGPDAAGGVRIRRPAGGLVTARIDDDAVRVTVDAGDPIDETVLRSYCVGAAHQALSWVSSEALSVDADGEVRDLTIRSFGILRAVDTPPIEVEIVASDDEPVAVSDTVFAAVAAATWIHQGLPPLWPTDIPVRRA